MSTPNAFKRNYQKLWSWWRSKAASFSAESLVIAGFALFIWIGVTGYLTGRMLLAAPSDNTDATSNQHKISTTPNDMEHNKLVIPFLWGIGTLLALPYLAAINERIKESDKKKPIEITVDRKDAEYVASLKNSLDELPNRFDIYDEGLWTWRRAGEKEFKDGLDELFHDFITRQEAIGGLNEGLEHDVKDPLGIMSTIRTACDVGMKRNPNDPVTEEVELFYKCVYAYIRAWLVCSIQYNTPLPINSIFDRDPNRREMYENAIRDFSDRFNYEPTDKFLKTPRSRKVVQEYLGKLVTLIQNEKNPDPDSSAKYNSKTTKTST